MPQHRKYDSNAERQAAYRERQRQAAYPLRDQSERQLAVELINAGYKVLAKKLHPDKGGSQEAMLRLHRVRDMLTRQVQV